MFNRYFAIASLAAVVMFSSCKKKEEEPGRKELLTSGKWRTASNEITLKAAGLTNTTNVLGAQPLCKQDDLTIFRGDNHLITDEGPTTCIEGDPQEVDNGTWILSDHDTRLLLITNGITMNYKINSLNSGDMQLQFDTSYAGFAVTNVLSYIRQN